MQNRMDSKTPVPIIIIHDLDEALTAACVSVELNIPIILHSAPVAAAYLGAQAFHAIVMEAQYAYPDATVEGCLDCGDMPGYALNALRHGLKIIRIRLSNNIRLKIENIAVRSNAQIMTGPVPFDAFVLSRYRNAQTFLHEQLCIDLKNFIRLSS